MIVEHLLRLQYSPAQDPRSGWIDSVLEHRNRLEYDLTPRLRQILEDELPRVYRVARRTAEQRLCVYGEDTAAAALPATCPLPLTRSSATGSRDRPPDVVLKPLLTSTEGRQRAAPAAALRRARRASRT